MPHSQYLSRMVLHVSSTSAFSDISNDSFLTHVHSCFAHRLDLDGEKRKDRRSQRIADEIVQTYSKKTAWREWGVVAGVQVWQNVTWLEDNHA